MTNKYSSTYPAKERASFENFISVNTNQIAKSTAIEFALSVTPYNVLGISSTIGNGATHLALSILNEIEKQNHKKEIFYSSYNELVMNNQSENELTIFNNEFLENKSLILIDSFYETSNKEFINKFFEVLKNVKAKIIFTYTEGIKISLVQKEIHLFSPSRIEKEKIIINIQSAEKINLSSEIINYISYQNNISVREIEGLILTISAREKLGKFRADIEFVKNIYHKMKNYN
jgi:chromosomal replication initiation ATPase DnaA